MIRMLDPHMIWQTPPKGHDAADAEHEGLRDHVIAALDPAHLIMPPRHESWYDGDREVMVLTHSAADRWLAWCVRHGEHGNAPHAAPTSEAIPDLLRRLGLQETPVEKRKEQRDRPRGPVLPWSTLDTDAIIRRWMIGEDGVVPMIYNDRSSQWKPGNNSRITDRPIWPDKIGHDLATDAMYIQLAWHDQMRRVIRGWISDVEVRRAHPLIELPSSPVTDGRHRGAAQWITYASSHIRAKPVSITSRAGWIQVRGHQTWVWPGTGMEYIGPDLPVHVGRSHQDDWLLGLRSLVEHGEAGYPAIVAVGFAATAPLSRLHKKRNPVLGFACRTSKGKGAAMSYACSLWCSPDALTVAVGSSVKGLQDKAQSIPDLPCWLDELQQMLDQGDRGRAQAAEAIYYLANGVRRTTSSKEQRAVGGERRFGCGMYASEATIVDGLAAGVQSRVIELTDHPCPDAQTANDLYRAARHAGAWAEIYGRYIQEIGAADIASRMEIWADQLRERTEETMLRGDDCDTIAMVCLGLVLLGLVTNTELPVCEIEDYLIDRLNRQRSRQVDKETEALHRVIGYVLGLRGWKRPEQFGKYSEPHERGTVRMFHSWCQGQDGPISWKTSRMICLLNPQASGDDDDDGAVREEELSIESLDIQTDDRQVQAIMSEYGGETRVLAGWHAQGWIQTDGRHRKVKKTWKGRHVGRVVRLTSSALEAYDA